MMHRWYLFGFELQTFSFVVPLMFLLQINGCWSINLEGMVLLKFRAGVVSDPYGALSNWRNSDSDPCMWYGVRCVGGTVRMLDLKGLSLGGTLAPELGKLRNLQSLILYKNHFSGTIPREISGLTMLELLDLRSNNLNGTIPAEIGNLQSLKRLLVRDNKFNGSMPSEVRKLSILTELQCDQNLISDMGTGIDCINRKFGPCVWKISLKQRNQASSLMVKLKGKLQHFPNSPLFKFGKGSSHGHGEKCHDNLKSSTEPYTVQNVDVAPNPVPRRRLLESSNLAAAPITGATPEQFTSIPSLGSGSFPAIPNSPNINYKKKPTPAPAPSPTADSLLHPSPLGVLTSPRQPAPTHTTAIATESSNGLGKWKYMLVLPAGVFVLGIAAALLFVFRNQGGATIGPWKTGLSGQLQKAFVTGVPKLNRSELETACEDFSNIIRTGPAFTVFKGTLSSGVEIAVASTSIVSAKDWSKHSEMHFRKKVDSLSRVNHKNFMNLLGYCEEDLPFHRMMVFEYAPNGSLFEHLHVKEHEHLDWPARMRIIMGVAYCMQYTHHELNPPISHPELTSNNVLLTDDYAAKISELGFWKELAQKGTTSGDEDKDPSELPLTDPESNIYSFGILLLETISGKLPYSEEEGSLVNWAMEYLNDRRSISYLIDPSLKEFKDNELDVICEVILDCIKQDPRQRPTMKEVTAKLREVISISPDAATPRLSPLWWAELEILSVEAS
ncbi:protein MALE DISCOVERER 1-like isoform X2 [Magnolia sinica]|uniref:protein MALE DISCOVERER 1-like isoform X2 n=1 Tax=Magnolia sinica TaxID=86752 RepID=UPI002658E31B|nr:protein MALE DISCOVERER 1-like isoform X2 [Magnolia sinica]